MAPVLLMGPFGVGQPVIVGGVPLFFHRFETARVFAQLGGDVLEVRANGADSAPELRRIEAVLVRDEQQRARQHRRFGGTEVVVRNHVTHAVRSHSSKEGKRLVLDASAKSGADGGVEKTGHCFGEW